MDRTDFGYRRYPSYHYYDYDGYNSGRGEQRATPGFQAAAGLLQRQINLDEEEVADQSADEEQTGNGSTGGV